MQAGSGAVSGFHQPENADGIQQAVLPEARHAAGLDGRAADLPVLFPQAQQGTVEGMEIDIIDHAAVTILCTEERIEQIEKAHPKKVIVIHNSPDVPEPETVECVYDYAYCGSLCDMRLIKEILDGYKEHNGFRFAFAGNDKYQKEVKELAGLYGGLEYFGTVPYSEVLEIEKKSKVLSAIYEPSIRNHRLCAPNKFYEALALGKPVIVCRGTGIDRIVEEQKIGMVINYDAEEFYEALTKLVSDDALCAEMGKKARMLYEKEYNWKNMKDRLKGIYNAAAQNRQN